MDAKKANSMSQTDPSSPPPPQPLSFSSETKTTLAPCSDLLSRVSAFLPQIRKANETIVQSNTFDATLQVVGEDDYEQDDGDDSNDNRIDDETLHKQQMVEFNFAVGDMQDNPVFEMLAEGGNGSTATSADEPDDDSRSSNTNNPNDNDDSNKSQIEELSGNNAQTAMVGKLLQSTKKRQDATIATSTFTADSTTRTSKKHRPLITEMD